MLYSLLNPSREVRQLHRVAQQALEQLVKLEPFNSRYLSSLECLEREPVLYTQFYWDFEQGRYRHVSDFDLQASAPKR